MEELGRIGRGAEREKALGVLRREVLSESELGGSCKVSFRATASGPTVELAGLCKPLPCPGMVRAVQNVNKAEKQVLRG